MNNAEHKYLKALQLAKDSPQRPDRTGTGTRSIFAPQPIVLTPEDGWCLPYTKRLFARGVIAELCWMLQGHTHVGWLQERGVHIWDEWAGEDGELGPVYGAQLGPQWGPWLDELAANPYGRRHILTTWDWRAVAAGECALPPCHGLVIQGYVRESPRLTLAHPLTLDLQVYQRSADVFLGLPFNLLSYQIMHALACRALKMQPGRLTYVIGDLHLYANHEAAAREQLGRALAVRRGHTASPESWRPRVTIDMFACDPRHPEPEQISVVGYEPMGPIRAQVSV